MRGKLSGLWGLQSRCDARHGLITVYLRKGCPTREPHPGSAGAQPGSGVPRGRGASRCSQDVLGWDFKVPGPLDHRRMVRDEHAWAQAVVPVWLVALSLKGH